MIATAGLSARTNYGYSPATLPEPFEDLIRDSDGFILDLPSAAYAVRLLAPAVAATCEHAAAAHALLDVLIGHDRRVWPAHYARQHFHRSSKWRQAIDEVTVDRILDGDDATLDATLDAFAPVAEELHSLLAMLPEHASAGPQTARLHQIWPRLLDCLLPEARDLSPGTGPNARQPYSRDVENLDRALLLVPPAEADQWPMQDTIQLAIRWLHSFQSSPHVADRALLFLAQMGWGRSDVGIELLLDVLGDNIATIRRQTRYTVAWLQLVLNETPAGPALSKARTLLDRLAAAGDDHALSVQQQLEA